MNPLVADLPSLLRSTELAATDIQTFDLGQIEEYKERCLGDSCM